MVWHRRRARCMPGVSPGTETMMLNPAVAYFNSGEVRPFLPLCGSRVLEKTGDQGSTAPLGGPWIRTRFRFGADRGRSHCRVTIGSGQAVQPFENLRTRVLEAGPIADEDADLDELRVRVDSHTVGFEVGLESVVFTRSGWSERFCLACLERHDSTVTPEPLPHLVTSQVNRKCGGLLTTGQHRR